MAHRLSIRTITPLARNVYQYDLERPEGFDFEPGQWAHVAIDKPGWEEAERPFSFTGLPDWDRLQFMIKSYPDKGDVTKQLARLVVGDRLIVGAPHGSIRYRGPGVFIAGGAGVTPFVPILRALDRDDALAGHRLFLANKRTRDIFPHNVLDTMAGLDVMHVLSHERITEHAHGMIDRQFLSRYVDDLSQTFYVCGPPQMAEDVRATLVEMGADPDALVVDG
ncbi:MULTISPECIES: FAD-binding oxidoreductase [unclassified Roseitalea]|uniref:FAD-binding oxidoreductase n=1 Tax=unclassified Roseitalea TaxID=2639107 RepID=UPI00273ED1F9|nr:MULTISPECIES: FAD-binding oxidoreductase [unclassified Roseitalea]